MVSSRQRGPFDEMKPPFQNQSHQIKSRMTDYLTIATEKKHLVEAHLEIFLVFGFNVIS